MSTSRLPHATNPRLSVSEMRATSRWADFFAGFISEGPPEPELTDADIGLDPQDYAALRDTPALRAAAAQVAEAAAGHLQAARRTRPEVPQSARAAVLSSVIANRFLLRLKRANYNPFAPELAIPDPLQSWRLFAAGLRRRF